MTAYALWTELVTGGWDALSRWRADRKSEGLHLDFKQGGFDLAKQDVRRDDLANLARTMSAFGNTEGGVLVFGPETERGRDKREVLTSVQAIHGPLEAYVERLRQRVRDSTIPTIPGVQVAPIADPAREHAGAVAVYVRSATAHRIAPKGPIQRSASATTCDQPARRP